MELEKLLVNAGKVWPASKLSVALWRRGGKRKESLQLRLWNLNICIEKVDAECWLAEMTLVMTSLPWRVFFSVCLHLRSFPLRADWRKSDSSVDGEPQENWRWNSNSRDVVASSPSFSRPAARAPGELASRLDQITSSGQTKYVSQALYQTIQTTKLNSLWKPVRLTSFQKPQCNPFFSKFVHPYHLLYLLCHLYLLLMFWAVISVFQSFGDSPH